MWSGVCSVFVWEILPRGMRCVCGMRRMSGETPKEIWKSALCVDLPRHCVLLGGVGELEDTGSPTVSMKIRSKTNFEIISK